MNLLSQPTLLLLMAGVLFAGQAHPQQNDTAGKVLPAEPAEKEMRDSTVITASDAGDPNGKYFIQWEDSLIRTLYPEVTVGKGDPSKEAGKKKKQRRLLPEGDFTNPHVSNTCYIDTGKDVGEIPLSSTVHPSGSLVCSVPVEIAPGKQGFAPSLSFSYNHRAGNGVMGVGWGIGGLSCISRISKSVYYDAKTEGATLSKEDALTLDGVRLIRTGQTSSSIQYETEQGRIKVTALLAGNTIRRFQVKYPDGRTAVFGNPDDYYSNQLQYPLTSVTDLKGNSIAFNYSFRDISSYEYCHPRINSIVYNGGRVDFEYTTVTRPDPVIEYRAGAKATEKRLLSKVICKSADNSTLRTYEITYSTQKNNSLLTQIDCSADGHSLNPLRFFYGEGNNLSSFSKEETTKNHSPKNAKHSNVGQVSQ